MKLNAVLLSSALALSVFVSAGASAASSLLPAGLTAVPLAAITNDRDSSVSEIKLMLNNQSTVRGIYLETHAKDDDGAKRVSGQVYWLGHIESHKGVVLGQGQGVKAILLRGNIQARGAHGSLVISYLSNGIFRHYHECRINLKRVGPRDWRLVNAYDGHQITHIEVQTWALGISTLANVCPVDAA